MTQDSKHAFWSQQIQTWECSQIGQKEFCRQRTLSYPQFCYWRKRFKRQAPASGRKLIPVMLSSSSASVSISLPPGIVLEVAISALAEVLPVICRTVRDLA